FMRSATHLAWGGHLGKRYDPFIANTAATLPVYDLVGRDTGRVSSPSLFALAPGLTFERVRQRGELLRRLDGLRPRADAPAAADAAGAAAARARHREQAVDLLLGRRMQDALDLAREPQAVRERYGKHLWCQQALMARRMVEAGAAFVTLDLSYHTASGTWDTHGDNIPPYGGTRQGPRPLFSLFDHLVTSVGRAPPQQGEGGRGLLNTTGEFGRTTKIGTQGSTDGRNHWPYVLSMALAGGGLRHGQVIGSTEKDGGQIATRPVTPMDLAATIYRHMGVPLDTEYTDE